LKEKLSNLPKYQPAQITLIATWLTELYLAGLCQTKNPAQRSVLQGEFKLFLDTYKSNLDKTTTYNLLSSHGLEDELLYYALISEDYDHVIRHYLRSGNYLQALATLTKQTKEQLYYKYSPELMSKIPGDVVYVWLMSPFLQPRHLIPALTRYRPPGRPHSHQAHPEEQNQAIRYLQSIVDAGNTDTVIHNHLVSLYSQEQDEGLLLSFLGSEPPCYDLKYALRLCTQHNKMRACVLLYGALGLFEEAVDLALKIDIGVAKKYADQPHDEEMRKKLWLRIARHVVEEQKDIKRAMAFLKECSLLKIEDILPFFPDFVLIDDFKDEICKSLKEYNQRILVLKSEMDEATRSADFIREDVKKLAEKYRFVGSTSKCGMCHHHLLSRSFYVFPCTHSFHVECFRNEMAQYMSPEKKKKIEELEAIISNAQARSDQAKDVISTFPYDQSIEGATEKLNELVASECILCGDVMTSSLDLPFVLPDEVGEASSWQV